MARSLSVGANMQRRSHSYFGQARTIHEPQDNETGRLRWRRLFLNASHRLIASSVQRKLREATAAYRERVAFNAVVPKLKQGSSLLFQTHLELDRKDMMKTFSENLMKWMISGRISEVCKISKAMEFLPKQKKLNAIMAELDSSTLSYKLALLKICLDLREAYYRCCKPVFNLKKLYDVLQTQIKIAELLKEKCSIEVILYLKTMTSKCSWLTLSREGAVLQAGLISV